MKFSSFNTMSQDSKSKPFEIRLFCFLRDRFFHNNAVVTSYSRLNVEKVNVLGTRFCGLLFKKKTIGLIRCMKKRSSLSYFSSILHYLYHQCIVRGIAVWHAGIVHWFVHLKPGETKFTRNLDISNTRISRSFSEVPPTSR